MNKVFLIVSVIMALAVSVPVGILVLRLSAQGWQRRRSPAIICMKTKKK